MLVELVEDGPAQGGALGRVGAGAQLVEQAPGCGRRRSSRMRGDARDVRAERAERLLEALFVADVGQDVVEDRHIAALARPGCACPHWAIRQSRPVVFSDTVLPPVFGPGDDQQVEGVPEADVDRHHFALARWPCRASFAACGAGRCWLGAEEMLEQADGGPGAARAGRRC